MFLSALEARGVVAHLAQVGDAIDFVVTVGVGETGLSRGVLERQTQTGTVAMRTVDDVSCAQVADALALTLSLAVDGGAPAEEATAPAPPQSSMAAPTPAAAPDVTMKSSPAAQQLPSRLEVAEAASPTRTSRKSTLRWSLGAFGTGASGITPEFLPGASLFVGLDWVRVGPTLALGSHDGRDQRFDVRLLGARLEGCPLRFGGAALYASPCVAVDVAQLHSEGTRASGVEDDGVWVSSDLAGRLQWELSRVLAIEAELGAFVAFTRYALVAGSDPATVVHRTSRLGAAARLGTSVHFP